MIPNVSIESLNDGFNANIMLGRNMALHIGFHSQNSAQIWVNKMSKKIKKQTEKFDEQSGYPRTWSM